MRTTTSAFLLLCGCAVLHASETRPADVRFAVMLNPETEGVYGTYRLADGGGSAGTGDHLDMGYRVEVGLVTRLVQWTPQLALVGGGWVFYADQESSGSTVIGGVVSGPMSYLTLGVDLHAALEARLNPWFSLEVGPVVGVGTTRFSDTVAVVGDAASASEETGHGEYVEAGLNLGVFARNTRGTALFSLGLRYLVSYGEADNRFAGLEQDVEIRQHGFAPYVMAGLTF
jgi:hypothetical protein